MSGAWDISDSSGCAITKCLQIPDEIVNKVLLLIVIVSKKSTILNSSITSAKYIQNTFDPLVMQGLGVSTHAVENLCITFDAPET